MKHNMKHTIFNSVLIVRMILYIIRTIIFSFGFIRSQLIGDLIIYSTLFYRNVHLIMESLC